MRVATYFRVSTRAQGENDRYGLPRQRSDVLAYIERQGHEIVGSFEDVGFSGATADRPGLAALLAADGFEAVVVPSWDRLARDTTLDGYLRYSLEKRGIAVFSATQENGVDPIAKLTQSILAAVAGYERHLIAQRLAGSRRVKAALGGYAHGQPPYGTRAAGGVLEINESEWPNLAIMQELKSSGLTIRRIAAHLNGLGITTRYGKKWGPSSVHGALTSAARALRMVAPTTES